MPAEPSSVAPPIDQSKRKSIASFRDASLSPPIVRKKNKKSLPKRNPSSASLTAKVTPPISEPIALTPSAAIVYPVSEAELVPSDLTKFVRLL